MATGGAGKQKPLNMDELPEFKGCAPAAASQTQATPSHAHVRELAVQNERWLLGLVFA